MNKLAEVIMVMGVTSMAAVLGSSLVFQSCAKGSEYIRDKNFEITRYDINNNGIEDIFVSYDDKYCLLAHDKSETITCIEYDLDKIKKETNPSKCNDSIKCIFLDYLVGI